MRITKLATMLAACLAACGAARAECPGLDPDHETDRVLVVIEPGVPDTIDDIAARNGLTVVDFIPQLGIGLLRVTPPDTVALALDRLDQERRDGILDRAHEHHHVEAPEGVQQTVPVLTLGRTQADYLAQPAAGVIHTTAAHARFTGQGVLVAIVDGGASMTNPETAGAMAGPGLDVLGGGTTADVPPNGLDDDGDTMIDEGAEHATQVAGLIHLAAPGAQLLHVRVLDDEGRGNAFDMARGILAAVEAGADVINLSLAIAHDARAVERAIEHAAAQGVVIVVAAGNRGLDCADFPADRPEVIGVAAVDGALARASFSNASPQIALSAPGTTLLSTYSSADWAEWDGTSFAAPLVSGGAALVLERYPAAAPDLVKAMLRETSQPGLFAPDVDGMGAGVLDLGALAAPDDDTVLVARDPSGSIITWTSAAATQDLVRGLVSALRVNGTSIDLGAVTCLAADVPATSFVDADSPPAGDAFFYLVRDGAAGSPGYGRSSAGLARTPASGDCP